MNVGRSILLAGGLIALSAGTSFASPFDTCADMALPTSDNLSPPPVFYRTGGKGWSLGHILADPTTRVRMSPTARESLGYADIVFGVPKDGGQDVQIFWGTTGKLCGLDEPLVVSLKTIREIGAVDQPDPYLPVPSGEHSAQAGQQYIERDNDRRDDANQIRAADLLTSQQRQSVEQAATGVSAYLKTRADCFYEASVDPAIQALDERYGDQFGSYWSSLKRQTAGTTDLLTSLGPLMQPEGAERTRRAQGLGPSPTFSPCKGAGLAVAFALMQTIGTSGFKPDTFAASQRLIKGGGRSR